MIHGISHSRDMLNETGVFLFSAPKYEPHNRYGIDFCYKLTKKTGSWYQTSKCSNHYHQRQSFVRIL